jgi:hypothetical protein
MLPIVIAFSILIPCIIKAFDLNSQESQAGSIFNYSQYDNIVYLTSFIPSLLTFNKDNIEKDKDNLEEDKDKNINNELDIQFKTVLITDEMILGWGILEVMSSKKLTLLLDIKYIKSILN